MRRSSSYYASLEALNARLKAQGKPPVNIVLADENLEDEDILEMMNAGIIDSTVVDSYLATFWQQMFTNLRPHPGTGPAQPQRNRLGDPQGLAEAQGDAG